jgi:hypothetical protein
MPEAPKPDPKAKSKIPSRPFTDPARRGTDLEATCQIYEPHDYNRKLLESQRARGVAANIPQVPTLGRTHTIAIKKPKQLDLVARAKAIREAARQAEQALIEQEDVLPDASAQFGELDG